MLLKSFVVTKQPIELTKLKVMSVLDFVPSVNETGSRVNAKWCVWKKKPHLRTYKLLSTWALEKSKVHLLFNVQKIAKPAVPCLCCLFVLQRFAINFIQITISHFIHLKLPSLEPVSCRIRQQPSHLFTQQHLQFPNTILYLWRQRYLNNCSETRGFHICLT